MTTEKIPTPFDTLAKHLPKIEKGLILVLVFGIILTLIQVDSIVTGVSLIGLGITFLLYAYRPIDIEKAENEEFGFPELIGLMILPKVLWISSVISIVGLSFYMFDFGNDGYKQMLILGGSSILTGTLLLLVFAIKGVKNIRIIVPILFRAIPILIVAIYLTFNQL